MMRLVYAVAVSTFLIGAGVGSTQTIQDARVKLGQQDYAGAAEVLRQVVQQDPEQPQAWMLLGFASFRAGENEAASDAYVRATDFEQSAPTAMYNLGLVWAARGERDSAFKWLGEAKATGAVDMTQLAFDSDAVWLRHDPRFMDLFPSDEEFSNPFVEDVEIIHEWIGEATGDQFGWIARNIGDVDGEGVNDVTTSAPTNTQGGTAAGKVYVFSGRTGALIWAQTGEANDRLGLGIEAAGDVNADGVPDVIAGAPGGDKAVVYSGRDGEIILTIDARQEGELFGRKVGDLGDINGDGHDDVIIGGPQNDDRGEDAGAAYVVSGADGTDLHVFYGEEPGDRFGSSAGGWSGPDGEMLIVIGSPNSGEGNRGRTYVYDGLTDEPKFVIESDETGFALGAMFVSVVGDVDADGTPDVYASDWANQAKGRSTGRIYIHSGATGERLYTKTGEAAGDGFGIGVADAGDVDSDGYDDLVIGAWRHGAAAPAGGKTYIYSGRTGELMSEVTSRVMGDTFGFDATGMGDVNGDGVIDYLLTSAWSAIVGPRSGRMFIISGNIPEGM